MVFDLTRVTLIQVFFRVRRCSAVIVTVQIIIALIYASITNADKTVDFCYKNVFMPSD